MRFADTTPIDLAAGGTPVDLELAHPLSMQPKLVLAAHEVYLPKPKLAVEAPGGVQASFDCSGAEKRRRRADADRDLLTIWTGRSTHDLPARPCEEHDQAHPQILAQTCPEIGG